MSKLGQQISELKKNTPKHIQWLLLGAAFVVVLILMTLLMSGNDSQTPDLAEMNSDTTKLIIKPDTINWSDSVVGQKKNETIKISATAPVNVVAVERDKELAGLEVKNTCTSMGEINKTLDCTITASFTPTVAMPVETTIVSITWHDADKNEEMKHTDKIVLTLGATAPKAEAKPEPKIEKKPVEQPAIKEEIIEKQVIEEKPVKQEIVQEVETIAPAIKMPEIQSTEDTYTRPPEACSDFAFAGYDKNGRQIGWIKPQAGAYKFHPFSDTDCSKPTGIYNPETGIITDINNSGKKIGTDAEHIQLDVFSTGALPELSNSPAVKTVNRARQLDTSELKDALGPMGKIGSDGQNIVKPAPKSDVLVESSGTGTVTNSAPYDRTFILRQYKPIPATIVSDVRADIETLKLGIPVRATVDRNVYSDNGRTVVIPTGTLLLGYVQGEIPGPYKAIGRMNINWYQFILPNGVEFNFPGGNDPYSGDSQGRVGVPGRGSTDYLEQFFMPMLTAMVPAAVNLIAPISDAFVNQIDLDNNTVVQSGTMRSSELAKNEIITAWNSVAQKLMVDMMNNTVPPFTIPAGTRITVYSPVDLQVTCGDVGSTNKKCAVAPYENNPRRDISENEMNLFKAADDSWIGQARSFRAGKFCTQDKDGIYTVDEKCATESCDGYSYSTLKLWCESMNYKSKTEIKQEAYHESEVKKYQDTYGTNDAKTAEQKAAYDEMVGIQYDDEGYVVNPYQSNSENEAAAGGLTCEDGTPPDSNGCCTGEIYTDMGEQGFNCCPSAGGDCFPPLI